MPTSAFARQAIAKALKGQKVIFELGSGWGHLAFTIAKTYPQSQVIAVENSWIPYCVSRIISKILNIKNIKFLRRDFWSLDLKEAQCVVCYQYRQGVQRLYAKLEKETLSSVLFISHVFAVEGVSASQTIVSRDIQFSTIYIYNIIKTSESYN